MSKPKKEGKSKPNVKISNNAKVEDREGLKQMILQLTEQKVDDQFSDNVLDRENEKIELLNGSSITIKEIKEIIAHALQEYSPKFPKDYYREINRLNNWEKQDDALYHKPPIVGRYTNEIIYNRFSKEILPTLQYLNPYIHMGIRKHKHHQWLTEAGKQKLEVYIQDAIRVMKRCSNWYEFRVKHAK